MQQMDKKLKAFPEVERVFGKLGRADTSTDPAPVDDDRDDGAAASRKSKWRPGMTKDKLVAEMDKAMQIVGYVNSWVQPIRARVMMQDTGIQTPVGIKVKGPDVAVDRGDRAAGRGAAARLPGHRVGDRRADLARATTSTSELDLERMAAARRHRRRSDADRALRHRRRQRRRHQAGRQDGRAAGDAVLARVHRHARQGPEHAGRDRRRPRRCRWATSRTSPCAKLPEMIRNDNGELAGYIYVYLQRRHRSGLRRARAGVSRDEPDAAGRLLARVDRAVPVRRGRARPAAHRRADDAGRSSSGCWSWRSIRWRTAR